jgi:hypothetical protein
VRGIRNIVAAHSIIKIPAIIGFSILGFLTLLIEAAAILYVPLYLLWIRPRNKGLPTFEKGEPLMTKSSKRSRLMWFGSSVIVLVLCFLLCKFAFFGLHGNKDWPIVMLFVSFVAVQQTTGG